MVGRDPGQRPRHRHDRNRTVAKSSGSPASKVSAPRCEAWTATQTPSAGIYDSSSHPYAWSAECGHHSTTWSQTMNQGDQNHINNHAIRLLQMSEGFGVSRAVQLAAELGVADLLGDAPRSTDDLAAATSTHPGALYRLLRALAGVGLFTEVEPGRFGLTPAGAQLRGDHPESLRSWVMFQGLFNGVYAEAMHSLRTGEPTVPLVFGEPLFDHLHHHPEHGEIFNAAMAEHSRLTGKALAAAYDFTGARQIVDVGGGDGSFLSAVLRANPEATGVVFDQPYLGDAAG